MKPKVLSSERVFTLFCRSNVRTAELCMTDGD